MADVVNASIWRRLLRRFFTSAGNTVAAPVTLAATSVVVTFARAEVDTLYGVMLNPSWLTTHAVAPADKTTTGFTARFGTGAPASATLDWITFRSE